MTLSESGCHVVGPVGSVAAAIEALTLCPPDVAVLDLNLNGQSAVPIADALVERGVPFVFVTGHDRDHLPERHRDAALVGKPHRPANLLRELAGVVRQSA